MERHSPNLIKISRDRTLKKLCSLKQKMIKNADILEKSERELIDKKPLYLRKKLVRSLPIGD